MADSAIMITPVIASKPPIHLAILSVGRSSLTLRPDIEIVFSSGLSSCVGNLPGWDPSSLADNLFNKMFSCRLREPAGV